MAKADLGTKRVCPETGRKFYDLDKDPIVSPYTGKEYELSFFEGEANMTSPKPDEAADKPSDAPADTQKEETTDIELDDDSPEIISLDDAEENVDDDDASDDDIPDIPDIPEMEDDEDDDDNDTFLEDDEEDDDLSDVIVGRDGDDDEV